MFTRLTHAAIAFALTVVVYQAYVIFAVPFIEPGAENRLEQQQVELAELRKPREALHKHRELLAAYFPAEHWTVAKPPMTFETERMMVVLDDYHPRDDGQIRVEKCVMIFFPRSRVQGAPAPRDAIVLEAPHGAVLQMDEPMRPGLTGMGRIQWGKLIGDIVIRSDMKEPGPQDDLLVTTRDLNLNEDMIRTDDKAEMQIGPHWGRGRVLEIRLMAVERTRASSAGSHLGGIDYLEIKHDVRAQLSPEEFRVLPKQPSEQEDSPTPPVKIASRGRFRFDFPNSMASFVDQVQLVQEYSPELRDQLFCSELNLYFSTSEPVRPSESREDNTSGSSNKASRITKLRPASIEAKGNESFPVVLQAPSQEAAARCDRMRIELDARRVTFDARDEVELKYQGSEIHAPMIRYQAPPKGAAEKVGPLLAAGNGWIRSITGDDQSQTLEVSWSESMRMDRVNGKPEISLRGRPKFDMLGVGTLWANHLRVVLRERNEDGSEDQILPGEVVPERIVATGLVGIDSAELSGKDFKSLDITVQYRQKNEPDSGTPEGRNAAGQPMVRSRERSSANRSYHVAGDQLRVYLNVRDTETEVSYIGVEGNVEFRESSRQQQAQPLLVKADVLSVKHANAQHAEIDLKGHPASVSAGGMLLQAERIRVNRGSGNVWIDSPGQMELPMDRNLRGERLAAPQPMTITWQKNMELQEGRVTFRGKVRALTGEGVLDTERMVAVLSGPVQFDGTARQRRTEIEQIECWEGVHAQFQQRDQFGLTSMQVIELESIQVNLSTGKPHSGAITGQGRGELESVHLTRGGNPLKPVSASKNSFRSGSQRLGYLHVEFRNGLRGNLHHRKIEVMGDARAVYGPVDSWQQKLRILLSDKPGPGTIWITSDKIGVNESPHARRRNLAATEAIELYARGNVTIEGPYQDQGTFTIRAHRADYDHLKSLLILEGDGRRPAEMHLQEYPGAMSSPATYRKFRYNLETEEVNVEGFGGGEWIQLDVGQ